MSIPQVLPVPVEQPTISVTEAGRILGISKSAAYEAVRRGDIPVLRRGRRVVVPTAKLLAMLGLGAGQ